MDDKAIGPILFITPKETVFVAPDRTKLEHEKPQRLVVGLKERKSKGEI